MYVNSHFTITTVTLAFIYLRRNPSFYFIRNMFMVAMGIALVLYAVYPTAPPRFMPEWGFQDSVAQFTGLTSEDSSANALYNPFAAVPSMHVAFALMLGVPMANARAARAGVKALWLIYPRSSPSWSSRPRTTGGSTRSPARSSAGVAALAAMGFARSRPAAWAWRSARRPPPARGRALEFPAASCPRRRPNARAAPSAREYQALMRNRLIESRLTPNAISLTGLRSLCVVAAVLCSADHYFLGGVAFIVGSVCDTLDGRYSRMSGKGTSFGAFLDSTLDRMEEGIVLTAVAFQFSAGGRRHGGRRRRRRGARLADGLLHPRPRRGARGGVQGRHRRPRRARRHPLGRPGAREGRRRSSTSSCSSRPSGCSPGCP